MGLYLVPSSDRFPLLKNTMTFVSWPQNLNNIGTTVIIHTTHMYLAKNYVNLSCTWVLINELGP